MGSSFKPQHTSDTVFFLRLGLKFLVVFACLAGVVGLIYLEENWRGKRTWENGKKELEAKGERLDMEAFLPPPVDDADNILKAPGMARMFAGKQSVRIR